MKSFLILLLVFVVQAFAQPNKFLTISQVSNYEIAAVIDNNIHLDYGLNYPLTYQINISAELSNLKAFKKNKNSEEWLEIAEKTTDEFFNGIEAVRFDYNNSTAFVSITFAGWSDSIYMQITDDSGNPVFISFVGITKYYDNRQAVVTGSADDWGDYSNSHFVQSCREFRKRKLWLSTAIITNWCDLPSTWESIQIQLDSGYVEAVSHSRNHLETPYDNYESEVGGSKNDIIDHLSLPQQFRLYNKEYVYIWVAPYGLYDDTVDSLVGVNKYLSTRLYVPEYHSLPEWDEKTNKFYPFGLSYEIGKTPWVGGIDSLEILNSTFDSVTTAGGVYHTVFHPDLGVYLTEIFHQHLDHISERNNIWYTATGHLYLYYFAQIHSKTVVTVEENLSVVPEKTQLHRNYPNPFNATTMISYNLSKSERIQLKIFNALGQMVESLLDEEQSPGFYKYNWDASNRNSGVYFYVLQGKSIRLTGKMLLIK